ncbi:MAG TPA: divergent polysaccharide deacetylase family protein, partial [Alphaproteobacteria bacterium]|nr:divergent polysaccharide deacetylase family protein [Alphaproteobacteria bacterium]
TAEELEKRIAANLDAFSGYAGVNNHMGSAFTSHAPGMKIFMQALKKRNVFFLDSKTASESVAESAAREAGIRTTHRDIFLDHYEDTAHVLAALEQVERVARKHGSAVAIGHPKDVTLDALMQWLPTLEAKGFDLIPMSAMIERRQKRDASYTAAAIAADQVPMTPVHQAVSEETAIEARTAAQDEPVAATEEKPHTAATSKILPSHRRYNR